MSLPEIDTALFLLINKTLRIEALDSVFVFITSHPVIFLLPFAALALRGRRADVPKLIVAGLTAVALSDSAGHLLKDWIQRPRPCSVLGDITLLVGCSNSYGMPSNHSANAFAAAASLWYLGRNRAGLLLFPAAAVVGLSRIATGAHYPGDVLAGAALGIAAGLFAAMLCLRGWQWYEQKNYRALFVLFLAALSIFRIYYILAGPLDLSPDEAHYWEWSRRPDLSYYSKGPFMAWSILLATSVFGNTVFAVRLLAVLFSAGTGILLFRMARDMHGDRAGLLAGLLPSVLPLFAAFGILFTIDSALIFFWTLALYLLLRCLRHLPQSHPGIGAWAALGTVIGIGMLAKYSMALFFVSGLLLMCVRKELRPLLKSPGPYVAGLVGLAVFSPVIYWNWQHGWVTFRHTAGQVHAAEGLAINFPSLAEFVASQFGVMTPVILVLMLVALWTRRRTLHGSIFFWFSVPLLLFFVLKSVQGKVQANWALPAYIAGIVSLAGWAEESNAKHAGLRKKFVAAGIALALAVTAAAHYPSALHIPEKKDPARRLRGWKELGRAADAAAAEMAAEGPFFLFSDSYQVASELAFYMKGNPVTYCANFGRRMNQYDLWPGMPAARGTNALFVRSGDKGMPREMQGVFAKCERRFSDPSSRGGKMKFTLFKCYDLSAMPQTNPEFY